MWHLSEDTIADTAIQIRSGHQFSQCYNIVSQISTSDVSWIKPDFPRVPFSMVGDDIPIISSIQD